MSYTAERKKGENFKKRKKACPAKQKIGVDARKRKDPRRSTEEREGETASGSLRGGKITQKTRRGTSI